MPRSPPNATGFTTKPGAPRSIAEARRYLTIPNAVGNEALPTPNMLDAAA